MKNVIKSMVMTAAMAAAVMMGSAQASSMSEHEAQVAFGFRIGSESMPAGKYSISWNERNVFRFRHVETGRMAMFIGSVPKDSNDKGGVISFRCAGEMCALEGVKPVGSAVQYGRTFPAATSAMPAAVVKVALR
jgi:hypothetical protein